MSALFRKSRAATAPVTSQYEQAIAATRMLFLSDRIGKTLPTPDEVIEGFNPATTDWLEQRARSGIRDELVIAPLLDESFGLSDLVDAMNGQVKLWREEWKARGWTYGWSFHVHETWTKYAAHELNGGAHGPGWRISVLLNDAVDPARPGRSEALLYPGLAYAGLNLVRQHESLKSEQASLRAVGVSIEAIAPADAVLIDMQRFLARNALPNKVDAPGKAVPLVCQSGSTRFVQLRTQRDPLDKRPMSPLLKDTAFRFVHTDDETGLIGVRRVAVGGRPPSVGLP